MKDFTELGNHCGVDEVGRGAWSGPVVAAAVRFSKENNIDGLADSKTLSFEERVDLYFKIIETHDVAVCFYSSIKIDQLNILNSSLGAMEDAVLRIMKKNDNVYFDGNVVPKTFRSCSRAYSIIKGDSRIASVAAASIVAKVSRDFLMKSLSIRFPGYGWERNVGYGVPNHIAGIKRMGLTTEHRRSFKPIHKILCL